MNTVTTDYEQEVATLELSVEEFGVLLDPLSMFRVTIR